MAKEWEANMTFAEQLDLLKQSPLLDAEWYEARYPDVAAAGMSPAEHYLKYGALMGRDPGPDFSTRFYQKQNPDVAGSNQNPLVHYLSYGQAEGRAPKP